MLFKVRDKTAILNAKDDSFDKIHQIEANINAIEKAKEVNKVLRARVDNSLRYTADNEAELS